MGSRSATNPSYELPLLPLRASTLDPTMTLLPYPGVDRGLKGKWVGLSPERRFVCDLLHFSKRVPSVPSQRHMQLADVIAARRTWPQRASWCAIFIKAYSIVAAEQPELRRAFMPRPWPHLYEHTINVASFSLERRHGDEDGVFFTQVPQPEKLSLSELDEIVRHHQRAPIDSVPSFRRALLLSRLPLPLRRFVWWMGLYYDGNVRAHFFGTFGISVVGSLGAAGLHILSPMTTTLNYGTFESDGGLDVRITYDHRVMDGAPVARALAKLEEVLHGQIRDELLRGDPRAQIPDASDSDKSDYVTPSPY
jgi:hypothetical protein